MSTWRQKAIEVIPELRKEFEQPDCTIYGVFLEMRMYLVDAHEANDTDRLKKIYDFAEWCFRQKTQALWNAAGVAFYEHLGDQEITGNSMPKWVSRDIYQEIRPLLQARLNPEKFQMIEVSYR